MLSGPPQDDGVTLDKIALENNFINTISDDITIPLPIADYLQQERNLFVADYGSYVLENVRCATYAIMCKGEFVPLVDWNRAKETAMTLLTTPMAGNGITLHVEHIKYNFEKTEYDLPLSAFLSSCISDGCTPYVGIEGITEQFVAASLFLVNEKKKFNHVLKITIPRQTIINHTGRVSGTLHTYVPTGNIAELYAQ